MRSGMQTNVTKRLRVRTARHGMAWSWDNLEEKMQSDIHCPFQLLLFLLLKWKKITVCSRMVYYHLEI